MMPVVQHHSAIFKRNAGSKMPATNARRASTVRPMPALKVAESYFPERIREGIEAALRLRGKSARQVCVEMGIDERTLGNFQKGKTDSMELRTVVRVSNYLGLTVSQLLGEAPLAAAPAGASDPAVAAYLETIEAQQRLIDAMRRIVALQRDGS
jgi:transcriptional regulator with XRE-family HTH domain